MAIGTMKSKSPIKVQVSSNSYMIYVWIAIAFVCMAIGISFGVWGWMMYVKSREQQTPPAPAKVIMVRQEENAQTPPIYPKRDPEYPANTAEFQQIGVLVSNDTPEPTILPLFGRRKNRSRWEYYVASDKQHMFKLPVQVQKRMCDEDVGCEEIYNGDQVVVPDYGNRTFTARIYKYAKPEYL